MSVRFLLLLVAVVLFVLTAFGVDNSDVHIGYLGLAFFAAAFLDLADRRVG